MVAARAEELFAGIFRMAEGGSGERGPGIRDARDVRVAQQRKDGVVKRRRRNFDLPRSRRFPVFGQDAPKEFDLLALLAEDPGAVVTRQTILEEVWDPHWYGPTKTLGVHVASLRRKLGNPEWVETVRRVGLRLGDTVGGTPAQLGSTETSEEG